MAPRYFLRTEFSTITIKWDGINPAASVKAHSIAPNGCQGEVQELQVEITDSNFLQNPKGQEGNLWCCKRLPVTYESHSRFLGKNLRLDNRRSVNWFLPSKIPRWFLYFGQFSDQAKHLLLKREQCCKSTLLLGFSRDFGNRRFSSLVLEIDRLNLAFLYGGQMESLNWSL